MTCCFEILTHRSSYRWSYLFIQTVHNKILRTMLRDLNLVLFYYIPWNCLSWHTGDVKWNGKQYWAESDVNKLLCISEPSLRKVLNLVVCKIKFSLWRASRMFGVYVKIESKVKWAEFKFSEHPRSCNLSTGTLYVSNIICFFKEKRQGCALGRAVDQFPKQSESSRILHLFHAFMIKNSPSLKWRK